MRNSSSIKVRANEARLDLIDAFAEFCAICFPSMDDPVLWDAVDDEFKYLQDKGLAGEIQGIKFHIETIEDDRAEDQDTSPQDNEKEEDNDAEDWEDFERDVKQLKKLLKLLEKE